MADDGGVRRSATSGHKPKTEPIDFSKFKNRKPKDPKDIAQVGGHDRFAEEQALHGVDIPNPRSSSPDDEQNMPQNHVDASRHDDEHSQSHVLNSAPLKRSSNPNARCTGAHKVLSHEDAAEHYQHSMKSFESEACPFHQVESHAAKCKQEKKGIVQIHVNQGHKEGNKTQNSRCTGAHKVQDKNEACKHYQESMTKFQSEACSFHEVESHAAKCEQEKKEQGYLEVKQHQQVKNQNARCTGAHKVENKTQAAEHYKSSCYEFEKAGYSFHNVESHAQSMHQSSETHAEHGNTKETQHGQNSSHNVESHANLIHQLAETHAEHGSTIQAQHGQNKRCSGAHEIMNKQEAAEHYKSSCHEFENAGYSFNHVESHASSLKVGEHSESHQAGNKRQVESHHQAEAHHTESTGPTHAEGQNKRYSGAHKVLDKQEAAEHYKSSCNEFEKAGYSFNHVENHASSLKVGERLESHQRAESHPQAETHHTESIRNIHAEGQNKRCSGAHKVVDKSAAAEHYHNSCQEFEKSGCKFHDVELHAERLQKRSDIQAEQHSNSAHNSQESEFHAEQIQMDGHAQVERHSNTTQEHKASSPQHEKMRNARCSGAHKVVNREEAAAHYSQSCKEFENSGFGFSNIESDASAISQHEQHSEQASKSIESHVRRESQGHQAHGENKHFSGAHRIENKKAAAAHYNSTMESFRSEAGGFHDVEKYASTHIKDREVLEGSHRDEERTSAEESHFRSKEHEQDERLEDSSREKIKSPRRQFTHNVTHIATESPHYEFATDHLDSEHYREELKKEHIESRKQSVADRSNVNAHFSGAHRVLDYAAASEHYMSSYKHTGEEAYLREVHEEDFRMGREEEFDSKDFAMHSATSKRIEDERRESGSRHHSSAREDAFKASKRLKDERHEFESRSRSSAREEDSFERRRAEHGQNAHFSGAYKVHDTKAAADYYREEHRKAEEGGFRFDREESHGANERRISLHEEDRNAEESGSRFDREEHHRTGDRPMSLSEERHERHGFESSMESRKNERHDSRNARFSGAYKVVNKSMAADHYSEYIRGFRDEYDLKHMENYLDLASLAQEGQQAMESTEDDLSRHQSLGFNDERRELKRSSSWEEKSLRARHDERARSLSQVPDHRRGPADEFYDEKKSDLNRLTSRTLEEERRRKDRMEGTRHTRVHHVQDKDAARAHYLAYVRQFEDEGYSWDRIEEFVKEIVEKVEDFVEGKMGKVDLHVEDFDLGKKFDILSASREHSRERGRSGQDDIRDQRGSSQGWAQIERRGSHERRSSFESKFHDDERRSERRGSASSSSEGRRSRHGSHERRSSRRERRDDHHILGSHTLEHLKHEVKDAEHQIPGARAADHLKERLERDLGLEHGAHHDERDHLSSQGHQSSSNNKNSRPADGALGRRLSTNVLPHLMKSARARSRSPNPAARQVENREHERGEHESDHNQATSNHDTADQRREEHDQRANHHEGDDLLRGLGLKEHHRSSSEDRKHEERKREEERRMHDERNQQNYQEHHGTDLMQDHVKDHEVHDHRPLSHPGEVHNEGHHGLLSGDRKDHHEDHHELLSANETDHNEGHHGLLSADRMGRPSPKEIFHRRQASIKSPGGRKFAGNRPAGLQLPKTVGSHERRDSPPHSSRFSPKPNSRHTGAHNVGNKEAAARHMRDAYERSGNHVPFDRLEEYAAGLEKGRDNARMSDGQRPLPNRSDLEGRTGDSRRPMPGREQEHPGYNEGRASRNREEEHSSPTRPGIARQSSRENRRSQQGQAQRRESGLIRMSSQRGQPQRQNSRPQFFRPSDVAARYDVPGGENEDARRHFEEPNPYSPQSDSYNRDHEDNDDYEEGGEYDHERGDYEDEGAEYDDQPENDEYGLEDYDDQEPYSPEQSAPTRRRPAQPSSAHFRDTLRHTGMNGPGLDALNYFAERGWTKEHTSAAIYLGITGLLVFTKNYLGPGAEVQRQGQRGFAAGFGAGSASAAGSVKGPSSSMTRPIRGATRAPARAQI